jgi:Domain of unknown function (DUF1929)
VVQGRPVHRRVPRAAPLALVAAVMVATLVVAAPPRAEAHSRASADPGAEHMAAHDALRRVALRRARTPQGRRELRAAESFRPRDHVRPRNAIRARAAAGPPAEDGRWNGRFDLPIPAIHSVVLVTGKVLFWGERTKAENTSDAWLLDPATGALKQVNPPSMPNGNGRITAINLFCAGQSLLPDGRVLVTGGVRDYFEQGVFRRHNGLKQVFTFNPYNETWTRQPDMRDGRYYPSQFLLPNGETLILGGSHSTAGVTAGGPANFINQDVEIFTPSPDLDGVGSIRHVAGVGGESPTKVWYPHGFVLASGRTLIAGPERFQSWFFGGATASSYSWADVADPSRMREFGSAVMMPSGHTGATQVLHMSGAHDPNAARDKISTPDNELFDEATGRWSPAPPLNIARSHLNTVLLPDASMVTFGGGIGTVKSENSPATPDQRQIELWEPGRPSWRLGPAQIETRSYHSTAMLLPDGRVLSAGDNFYGGKLLDTGEYYEPAYLHKGPRPTIGSAPAAVPYGAGFTVGTPNADVNRAVLIAPSAVTHAVDMNQRHLTLPLTRRADGRGVDVVAPTGPNAAPPGFYMLFLLNDRGVPSVAKWVRLDPSAAAPGVLAAAAPPAPSPAAPATRPRTTAAPTRAATPSLRRALRSGLKMRVRCRRACRITVRLTVTQRTARRLRLDRRQVALGRAKLRRRGTATVLVRFTADARRKLRRAKSVTLLARTEIRPSRGRRTSSTRRLVLRR